MTDCLKDFLTYETECRTLLFTDLCVRSENSCLTSLSFWNCEKVYFIINNDFLRIIEIITFCPVFVKPKKMSF